MSEIQNKFWRKTTRQDKSLPFDRENFTEDELSWLFSKCPYNIINYVSFEKDDSDSYTLEIHDPHPEDETSVIILESNTPWISRKPEQLYGYRIESMEEDWFIVDPIYRYSTDYIYLCDGFKGVQNLLDYLKDK